MKTQELVKKLEEGVQEVFKSGRFQEWLKVQSTFHNYSFANTMLILAQKPEATNVAGFKAWQKLKRYVRKGEKGIAILAPIITKMKCESEEVTEKSILAGFRVVHVFDLSQTEGEDLPKIAKELETSSVLAEELILKLHDIAGEKGIKVISYPGGHNGANGYYNFVKQEIGLKEAGTDQQAKTFIHEIAHALTHGKVENYQEGEIVAEGTAFIVSSYFGLDTGSYSFEYVAAWASRAEKDAIKKVANTIQRTADLLIRQLQKEKALAS